MSDLISRHAAIDAVLELDVTNRVSWKDAVIDTIDALPSAEPEIVRCGECRHKCGEYDGYVCCDKNVWRDPKWYCADGEKYE